ncbi:MAG: hypothetical protein VX498_12180, partial [Myxococcota bacterium]|nr:hypothetical protein [Myxococcota bacterium]
EREGDEEPFVRLVLGADGRTGFGMTVMGEVYIQSLGAEEPEDYLSMALSERFQRGELWTMGRFYAALTVSQEILPILQVSVVTIANILDPSALVGPSLSWSVATNADFVIGGFFALGKRPEDLELTDLVGPDGLLLSPEQVLGTLQAGSEFGLLPHQGYAQFKLYF